MIYFFLSVAILLALVCLVLRYSILIPPAKGLPILMYHGISTDTSTDLLVRWDVLERHLAYIRRQGYTPILFRELINLPEQPLPYKPIIITFDDGYQSNADLLFPLLEKYDLKVSIALPLKYLGRSSEWDGDRSMPIMSAEVAKSAPAERVEYTLHSYAHIGYRHCEPEAVGNDVRQALSAADAAGIAYTPVLAYPYGGFPREREAYNNFCRMLEDYGIALGVRIGNRINRLPLKDKFQVCRIDIKGTDSFWEFKTKLRKGRVKRL